MPHSILAHPATRRIVGMLVVWGLLGSIAHAQPPFGTLTPTAYQTVLDPVLFTPISGACIWTYAAGTTTPVTTYNNKSLQVSTQNPNPIQADTAGTFVAYLSPGQSYKFVYEQSCVPPAHGAIVRTQDNIDATSLATNTVSMTGIAAVTLPAGSCAYLSDGSGGRTAGQWYLCDSANVYSSTTAVVGIVPLQIPLGQAGGGLIILSGQVTGLSGLVVGAYYYAGTAGALTNTAPLPNARFLGQADTATSLVLTPQDPVTATSGFGVIARKTTTTTVSNTTTETTLWSTSIPAGILGTSRVLHVSGTGLVNQATGAAANLTLRVKYGARTVAALVVNNIPTNNTTNGPLNFDVELMNTATATQMTKTVFWVANNPTFYTSGGAGGTDQSAAGLQIGLPTADVQGNQDSTVAQMFTVTAQMSVASAVYSIQLVSAYAEVK